jgi:hypothetical protein
METRSSTDYDLINDLWLISKLVLSSAINLCHTRPSVTPTEVGGGCYQCSDNCTVGGNCVLLCIALAASDWKLWPSYCGWSSTGEVPVNASQPHHSLGWQLWVILEPWQYPIYTASNDWMIGGWWIVKDLDGSERTIRGRLISLWLDKENNKLRDWKNVFTYLPLSSTHLWVRCSNFFNPAKKNSFGCAANTKTGKAKDLSAPLRNRGPILTFS